MKTDIILRNNQIEPYNFLNSDFDKLVLAMCPSSGKTETVIYYINELIKKNKDLKVLILPHSTNVLLNNFYDRLEQRNVCFTYSTDTSKNTNVHITLPQSTSKIKNKYDIIIVDEAHENYFAKTVQNIIKKTSCSKQILLTGTPSKFIGKDDFKIHFLALNQLDKNTIPKLRVDIIESYYNWNGNYNSSNEVKKQFNFDDNDTRNSIEKTFKFITTRGGNKSISKTLIVCHNIKQSNSVKSYLDSIGLFSVISNSKNDTKSELIQDFKKNKINILIVVNRARLGYDDTDLVNIIDMSGTLNPNLIYQMMARVLRGYNNAQKYYIRLTSKKDESLNSEIATSVALMLTDEKYISTFNGNNIRLKRIIIPKNFIKNNIGKPNNTKNTPKIIIDTNDIISFYKETFIEIEKNIGVYKFCEIQEVLDLLRRNILNKTLEDCKNSALNYKKRGEWAKKDKKMYQYAYNRQWLNECCEHMKSSTNKTLQDCIKSALKYRTVSEWQKKDKPFYYSSKKNGWLDECCKHMEVRSKKHTLEECKNSALKYKTRSEWSKSKEDGKLYAYSLTKGWTKDCCAHMTQVFKITTLEECKKSASKYNTRGEWAEKARPLYSYAHKHKWLDECCKHMVDKINNYTIEDCKKSALKYKSKTEWLNNDRKMFGYARYRGWVNECCVHMDKLLKLYTLEDCKINASKYLTKSEWRRKDKLIYIHALKNNWITECCHNFALEHKYKLEDCKTTALKYKTRSEWMRDNNSSYNYTRRKGWLNECCQHMNQNK